MYALEKSAEHTKKWNAIRKKAGRYDTKTSIVQIQIGLTNQCGCAIDRVFYFKGFSVQHDADVCDMNWSHRDDTRCTVNGQAVAGIIDANRKKYMAVMELNGILPHEEPDGQLSAADRARARKAAAVK